MIRHLLLINPNSSLATSAMMQSIAQDAAKGKVAVAVATATRAPPMIVTEEALAAAAEEVVEIGLRHGANCAGIIVGAFGDPGLEALRERASIPVAGICEASMREAARGGRRFGVATTTPGLKDAIMRRAQDAGVPDLLTGVRCSVADPVALLGDEAALFRALADEVRSCVEADGAQAVIIGGGPLGRAAEKLQTEFPTPVIAPIPCAVASLLGQ
ncbi:MAG: aspartate/glutamate racemase family protein [Proteobacteria bacterium]|nr:aspartate/glutamate racemase family protein [Pseudomonadota bacterium]